MSLAEDDGDTVNRILEPAGEMHVFANPTFTNVLLFVGIVIYAATLFVNLAKYATRSDAARMYGPPARP
jgi:hypothetical protein